MQLLIPQALGREVGREGRVYFNLCSHSGLHLAGRELASLLTGACGLLQG